MARSKQSARKKRGQKDSSNNGKGKNENKTPKVAVGTPKIAAKDKKQKALTKKQLIKQEKNRRRNTSNNNDDNFFDPVNIIHNNSAASNNSVGSSKAGATRSAKKKKNKTERKEQRLQQKQQKKKAGAAGANNKNSQNAFARGAVDIDGIPLHYKVNTTFSGHGGKYNNSSSSSSNNNSKKRSKPTANTGGGSGRAPFSLPKFSNPKRCLVPWWTPAQIRTWEAEDRERKVDLGIAVLEQERGMSSPSPMSSSAQRSVFPEHYLFTTSQVQKRPISTIQRQAQCKTLTWLSQLDAELTFFQQYVQVSPAECAARDFAVRSIQHVSQNNLEGLTPNERKDVKVHVFGSYATPAVCAFCSDVDMALFGVVPVPPFQEDGDNDDSEAQNTHIRFGGEKESSPSKQKNTRIQKWRDVLSECFADADAGDERVNDNDDDVPEETKNGDTFADPANHDVDDSNNDGNETLDDDAAGWQTALDQMLEGSNEGPDTIQQRRKRAMSATSMTSASSTVATLENVSVAADTGDFYKDLQDASSKLKASIEDQFEGAEDGNMSAAKEEVVKKDEASTDDFFVVDRVGITEENKETTTAASHASKKTARNVNSKVQSSENSSFRPVDAKPTATTKNNETKGDDSRSEMTNKKRALSLVSTSEQSENTAIHGSQSDSEDDTADKLDTFVGRKRKLQNYDLEPSAKRATSQVIVSPSSDEDDDNDDDDESHNGENIGKASVSGKEKEDADGWGDLHVSFVSKPAVSSSRKDKASFGPQGPTRVKVVKALRSLGSILRRRDFTSSIQVISRARVPIVKFETHLGFEGDVAMGGHNGTDTSQFAQSCVDRYKSFAAVVMTLKILLHQNKLDAPFTGGLGSFKLYVLVAYHLERHLAFGGADRPGEVLVGFFVRYGNVKRGLGIVGSNSVKGDSAIDAGKCCTDLQSSMVLRCDTGYEADLQAVFLLQHCVQLFNRCFSKIAQRYNFNTKSGSNPRSILVDLFDIEQLMEDRSESQEKANILESFDKRQKRANRTNDANHRNGNSKRRKMN